MIRTAYKSGCVELSIVGDLEDAEIKLGVREKRDTPKPRYSFLPVIDDDEEEYEVLQTPFVSEFKIGRNELCPY